MYFVLALCCWSLLFCVGAFAGPSGFDGKTLGQIGTNDLAHVRAWGSSARLKSEIAGELIRSGKSAEEVICLGYRFPGTWRALGGDRAPPFVCHFGTRDLHINWTVTLTSPDGRRYIRGSRAAMRHATDLAQKNPVWRWSAPDDSASPD